MTIEPSVVVKGRRACLFLFRHDMQVLDGHFVLRLLLFLVLEWLAILLLRLLTSHGQIASFDSILLLWLDK